MYARKGYFFIIIFFTSLFLAAAILAAMWPAAGYLAEEITYGASTLLILGLYKKARNLYNVRGNYCADVCGTTCCPDACSDCCDAVVCSPCTIARLGHHVFNYDHNSPAGNGVITYEPLSSDFDPMGELA